MVEKLLNCPFCGGEAILHERQTSECYAYVRCGNVLCGNDQPYPSEKQATKAWNTRHQPTEVSELQKSLKYCKRKVTQAIELSRGLAQEYPLQQALIEIEQALTTKE